MREREKEREGGGERESEREGGGRERKTLSLCKGELKESKKKKEETLVFQNRYLYVRPYAAYFVVRLDSDFTFGHMSCTRKQLKQNIHIDLDTKAQSAIDNGNIAVNTHVTKVLFSIPLFSSRLLTHNPYTTGTQKRYM